jgi:hypothetical protein
VSILNKYNKSFQNDERIVDREETNTRKNEMIVFLFSSEIRSFEETGNESTLLCVIEAVNGRTGGVALADECRPGRKFSNTLILHKRTGMEEEIPER